jgi:hypothetical protein
MPRFVLGSSRPHAGNTGHDPALVTALIRGTHRYRTPNTTVSNTRFEGWVVVEAENVHFVNCEFVGPQSRARARYPGWSGLVDCRSSGTLFTLCTMKPTFPSYWMNGINGSGFTAERCDISQSCDGVSAKGDVILRGCYVHDLSFWDGLTQQDGNGTDHASDKRFPGWSHNDCVQVYGGSGNRVEGCNLRGYFSTEVGTPGTAMTTGNADGSNAGRKFPRRNYAHCLFTSPINGAIDITINRNWFEGGEIGWQASAAGMGFDTGNSFVLTGNRFGLDTEPGYTGNPTDVYGCIDYTPALGDFTLSGNTFDSLPSVPEALRGQSVDPYCDTFVSQVKCQVTK